jgi:hypothetical protein
MNGIVGSIWISLHTVVDEARAGWVLASNW